MTRICRAFTIHTQFYILCKTFLQTILKNDQVQIVKVLNYDN